MPQKNMNQPRKSNIAPETVSRQQQIEAPQAQLVLPTRYIGNLKKASVTPSVKNVEHWKAVNTAAVTITDFLDGQDGQSLYILGDAHTTIANNANIKTNTAANKLLAALVVYHFTMFDGVWIEHL